METEWVEAEEVTSLRLEIKGQFDMYLDYSLQTAQRPSPVIKLDLVFLDL